MNRRRGAAYGDDNSGAGARRTANVRGGGEATAKSARSVAGPLHARTRRAFLLASAMSLLLARRAWGFAGATAFQARWLYTGGTRPSGPRLSASERWGQELTRRTSAPARLVTQTVSAAERAALEQPFLLWAGAKGIEPLTRPERRNLATFLRMGGVLLVDDTEPGDGAFGRSVRRQLREILPVTAPVKIDPSHVLFKSFYMLERPVGRVAGPPYLEAIVRGGMAQVIFASHDLTGALASDAAGGWALPVVPGGARQREQAIRLLVNIAMYVLCSDYKDDQVHARWLMRRSSRSAP